MASAEQIQLDIVANTAQAVREMDRFNAGLGRLEAATEAQTRGITDALDRINDHMRRVGDAGSRGSSGLSSFVGNLAAIGVTSALSVLKEGAAAFMDLSDAASNMNARLALATDKFGSYAKAQEDVRAIASATRSDLSATASLYSSIALQANDLGITQAQVATTTKTVGMAMKISGADAAASEGAIRQLGQALASGALRGDEFNSVNEAAPRLMQALADSMGVSRGQLRGMAADGKITADVLTKALTDPKIVAGLEAEFGKIPVTFADVKTTLLNSAQDLVGGMSEAIGTGSSLAGFLDTVKSATDALMPVFKSLGAVIGQIVSAVGKVASAFLDMFQTAQGESAHTISFFDQFTVAINLIGQAAEVVGNLIVGAFEIIGTVVGTVTDFVRGAFGSLFEWLFGATTTTTADMNNSIIGILRGVKFVTSQIPRLFRAAFASVTGIFKDVGAAISSFFNGNFGAFDGLGGKIAGHMASAANEYAKVTNEAVKIAKDTDANQRAMDRLLGRGGSAAKPSTTAPAGKKATPAASGGKGKKGKTGKTDAEKEEEKRIKELEAAQKKYNEALADYDQKMRESAYSAEQIAQVEGRRRAGLNEDLSFHSKETDAIDAKALAYYKLQKAKDAAKELDTQHKQNSTTITGLQTDQAALRNPEQETKIRQAAAQAALAGRIAEIRATEGLSVAQQDVLVADEQRIFDLQQQNAELERQNANTTALADFMGNLFESPKKAMKAFFSDLTKQLLAAILKATILGDKLGGSGGVGGLLKSSIMGALGFRASGGSVSSRKPYIVGEKGPELMVPGRAGEVINAHKTRRMMGSGGGGNVTLAPSYTIQLSGNQQQDTKTLAAIKAQQAQQNAQIRSQQNQRGWR